MSTVIEEKILKSLAFCSFYLWIQFLVLDTPVAMCLPAVPQLNGSRSPSVPS